MFFRDNPRGLHHELWVHAAGCRKYFNVTRHTVTYEILETYLIGEQPASSPTVRKTRRTRGTGMSQINRLSSGGRIDRNRPLTFSFNGQHYQGYAGDTLAAALLANGVDIVGRSFKYSRARGIVAAGAEEPNAILQIGSREATQIPNVRATQQALYGGLVATSTNGWPNVQNDLMGIFGKVGGKLMPPGFYYKTFMYPQSMWMTYESTSARPPAWAARRPRSIRTATTG